MFYVGGTSHPKLKEPVVSTLKTPIRQRLNYQSDSDADAEIEEHGNSSMTFQISTIENYFTQALRCTRQNSG